MQAAIHKVLLPEEETNYLFFTTIIEHAGVWYKIAVAEEVYADDGGPDVTGAYTVLVQSEEGTYFFNIHRDQEGNWEADIFRVAYELLHKIGTCIDKYHS